MHQQIALAIFSLPRQIPRTLWLPHLLSMSVFVFSFCIFLPLVPDGRLSWLLSAFEVLSTYKTSVSYLIIRLER